MHDLYEIYRRQQQVSAIAPIFRTRDANPFKTEPEAGLCTPTKEKTYKFGFPRISIETQREKIDFLLGRIRARLVKCTEL